jgi:hypothetical protein
MPHVCFTIGWIAGFMAEPFTVFKVLKLAPASVSLCIVQTV